MDYTEEYSTEISDVDRYSDNSDSYEQCLGENMEELCLSESEILEGEQYVGVDKTCAYEVSRNYPHRREPEIYEDCEDSEKIQSYYRGGYNSEAGGESEFYRNDDQELGKTESSGFESECESGDESEYEAFEKERFVLKRSAGDITAEEEEILKGYASYSEIQIMTMVMVIHFDGLLTHENQRQIFHSIPVTRTGIVPPAKAAKKLKLPYPGHPKLIMTAKLDNKIRGVIRSYPKGKWKNSVMIDISVTGKNVNIRLSKDNIHICGCKSVEMGIEAGKILIEILNETTENMKLLHENRALAKRIAEGILKKGRSKIIYFGDSLNSSHVGFDYRKLFLKDDEKLSEELERDTCGSRYHVRQCFEKEPLPSDMVDLNFSLPTLPPLPVLPKRSIDEETIVKRMKVWKKYLTDLEDTRKRAVLKRFIASQLSDLYTTRQVKEKMYWLFNICKPLQEKIKYKYEKVSLVQHRFNLKYVIDLTKLQRIFYHCSGDREFHCAYLPDQRYVKFQIISYKSPVPCGPTCKAHTFQVDRTGKVIYSCSVEEEAEYMYKRFMLMMHDIRGMIDADYKKPEQSENGSSFG